jgi:hypothetical protein
LAICDRRRFERRVAASIDKCTNGYFVPARRAFCGVPQTEPSVPDENYFSTAIKDQAYSMTKNRLLKGRSDRHGGTPLFATLAVATCGVLGMLIVDHGPWNKPKVKPAVVANYTTTGEAARAAGATVTPTEPQPSLEPVRPGPTPVHPVNPPTPP